MKLGESSVTEQGQVSVPGLVRRVLGIGPGSVIEWNDEDGVLVVRRTGQFSSEDIHCTLFPDGPAPLLGRAVRGVRGASLWPE